MTTSGHGVRDGRGQYSSELHVHKRASPSLPLPTLRSAAATPPAPQLLHSIQSRPLQANPAHPLLWNSSTTAGSTALQHRNPSLSSSASTPHTSFRGANASRPARTRGVGSTASNDSASSVGSSNNNRERAAHVLAPHRPRQTLHPHHHHSSQDAAQRTTPGQMRVPPQPVPAKKVAAVNYNALFQQEVNGPQRSPSPPPPPHQQPLPQISAAGTDSMYGAASPVPPSQHAQGDTPAYPGVPSPPSALSGATEGPLPPDVRRLISQSCTDAATVDSAEQQARRLISTGRRVKVYREELAAAEEERRDWAASAEQRHLVRAVLQAEVDDINARIQALLQERAICEAQLRDEDAAAARESRKLAEADERVTLLRGTIDGIVEETVVPRLMLQQLVPSLLIENYI